MSTDAPMKGWVAIVTGCGQRDGIGAATARELASQGCNVVVTDIEPRAGGTDDLEALVKDLRESGVEAEAARADISDEASCKRAVDFAVTRFGRLDVLVNNAGAAHGGERVPAQDVPMADWHRVFSVNATGTFLMSRLAAKQMIEQKRGRIVSIASLAAIRGVANRVTYSASKAAVIGMTVSLASECAPAGVTVNAVCPGSIATQRGRNTAQQRGGDVQKGMDAAAKAVPLGRVGTPQDVAALIGFLASPKAGYITGQVISADGGMGALLPRN